MLSNNSKVQLLIKIAATGALSFLLVLYGTQKKSSADTSLLTIISPSQGALVTPGSIITVEVGVDPDKIFPGGVVVLGPSGVDGPLFAPPFEFSVPVSKTIAIGTAELWALGIEADGSFEVSSPVTLHVERLDPPINFRVMPTQVLFRVIGEQRHLDVLGVFSDGVARTLNESIETVFTAEDQSVAMVSYTGVVTATGPGDTTITVEHKGIVTTIPISVLESLRGDINGDGEVNSDDLNEIIALSGNPASSPFDPADLNRNGVIDEQDQNILRTLCTDIDCVTGPSVLVPFVLGFNQAEAEARITNVGLVVGEVVLAPSDNIAAGLVVEQDPAAGASLSAGNSVDLVVSSGPTTLTVPDVVGLSQSDAEAAIVAAGLVLGTVTTEHSATVPAGDVTSQNPEAGTEVVEGSAVALVVSLGPVLVSVPSVVGQSQADAEAVIVAAGLVLGTVTTEHSATVPAGDVISQNPEAGTEVVEGSAVALVVSLGPVLVSVPSVVGQSQADAEAVIVAAGLVLGTVTTEHSATVPAGDVTSQNPEAGTEVVEGSAVALVVSLGPVLVSVPSVVGQSQADAEAAIVAAGLVLGTVTTEHSATVPAGDVISQNPEAGTEVVEGSAVALVVSLGPVLVSVPSVVGQSQADAEAAIVAAGLVLGTVTTEHSATVPAGDVTSQNPEAGTEVVEGSAVALVVSLGPVLVSVPSVVGQSQADAEAAIVAAGLVLGTVTTEHSATVPAGDVISQNPEAGTEVVEGSAVALVVSLGPVLVSVPSVVGQSQADAEAAIVAAGLVLGTVTTEHSATVPAGDVISQNPEAGTEVVEGSAVALVVSLGPVLVSVPSVVGQSQADAEAAIVAAGLVLGTVTTEHSATVPAGDVTSQNPEAGTEVVEGSAVALVVSSGPITIDIKPGSDTNSINLKSNGVIPVAILTTGTFDATTVDPLSVEFGPNGAMESHGKGHIEDADVDGDDDLVLHFRIQETGIACGDTSAFLKGETFDRELIEGSDLINTVGCK